MCTAYEVKPRKNKDGAKIIMVKKITTMQHRSTEQLNNCWFETSSDKL